MEVSNQIFMFKSDMKPFVDQFLRSYDTNCAIEGTKEATKNGFLVVTLDERNNFEGENNG